MAVGTGEGDGAAVGTTVVGRTGGEAAAMAVSLSLSAVFVDLISGNGKQTEEEVPSVCRWEVNNGRVGATPPTEIGQLFFPATNFTKIVLI
jgi:hypothetical protein